MLKTPEIPSWSEVRANASVVSLPLVTRFRGITARETMLLSGPEGWAEFAPFPEYSDPESVPWLAAALEFGWSVTPAPQSGKDRIRVNATLPAVAAPQVPEFLERFPGCRTVKVKVGSGDQTLSDDIARVRAVRAALGPEGRIRVDANGGWNVDSAEHAIHALAEFDLEYVEQPCSTILELAEIRERIGYMGIPIAADESLRKATHPEAAAASDIADVLIVKAAPLGGIQRALATAAASTVPVVVSSALESSVGISMGAYLAAGLRELDLDCGLGTAALLGGDVTDVPLVPTAGTIPVRRVPVDPDRLEQYAASAQRTAWWLARLERCYQLLASRPE